MSKRRVQVDQDEWYYWLILDRPSTYADWVELPVALVTRYHKAYAEFSKVQKLLRKHLTGSKR